MTKTAIVPKAQPQAKKEQPPTKPNVRNSVKLTKKQKAIKKARDLCKKYNDPTYLTRSSKRMMDIVERENAKAVMRLWKNFQQPFGKGKKITRNMRGIIGNIAAMRNAQETQLRFFEFCRKNFPLARRENLD